MNKDVPPAKNMAPTNIKPIAFIFLVFIERVYHAVAYRLTQVTHAPYFYLKLKHQLYIFFQKIHTLAAAESGYWIIATRKQSKQTGYYVTGASGHV